MLSVPLSYWDAECNDTGCRYAEHLYAECRGAASNDSHVSKALDFNVKRLVSRVCIHTLEILKKFH
jgi:hypothetical protein